MKQHPFDPISFLFGGLFTALGAFLVVSDAHWEAVGAAWILPAVLVVVGATILWSTLRKLGPPGEDDASRSGAAGADDESKEVPIPELSDG